MKKITILAGAAMLAASGAAMAQPGAGMRGERGGDLTRAEAAAQADRHFQRLDVNRDGRVTPEEMRAARERFRAERQQRMQERLAQATPEQRARFEQRRAQWQERRGQRGGEARGERRGQRGEHGMRGQRMFGEQGFVTAEQFRERALTRFDRMDLNRDGVVTAEERRQAREQMRERVRERRGSRG